MFSTLKGLAGQLQHINDDDLHNLAPRIRAQSGDEVFGELNSELRQLYALKEQLRRLVKAIETRLITDSEYVEMLPELQLRADLTKVMFWIGVMHQYPRFREGDLGTVFEGWRVGRRYETPEGEELPPISNLGFGFGSPGLIDA